MLHSASKIQHMRAGRLIPSIQEPTKTFLSIFTQDAREDFLFIGRARFTLGSSAEREYVNAWERERKHQAEAVR